MSWNRWAVFLALITLGLGALTTRLTLMNPSEVTFWVQYGLPALTFAFFGTAIVVFAQGQGWIHSLGMFNLLSRSKRMQLIELRDVAKNRGWAFSDDESLDILDFCYGLKQAAKDEVIMFWGKPDRNMFEDLNRHEVLDDIDRSHWRDFDIDASVFRVATDNLNVRTYSPRQQNCREGSFVDLHADRKMAMKWLRRNANSYKGHSQKK